MSSAEGVMSTNDDASNCKRYAVSKKYWNDDYIQYFVRKIPDRKAPEINRGYYIRNRAIRSVIDQFLSMTKCECQIVNIGAGFDTLYWNLLNKNQLPKHGLYELDLKPVVEKKLMHIKTKQPLNNGLSGKVTIENSRLSSSFYHLCACDITNVPAVDKALTECGIDKQLPTLFLAECVFVYISHDLVGKLLNYVGDLFPTSIFVDYDPVNLSDRFGEVMKQNLRGRLCNLLGAHPDLDSKTKAYKMFSFLKVKLLIDAYSELPQEEKQRMEKIEFLDEVDLLYDLLKHYCVCVACNDELKIGLNTIML